MAKKQGRYGEAFKAQFVTESRVAGATAPIVATLMETCELNGVNPEAWLAWVLAKIQDHPATKIDKLLPWNYQAVISGQKRPFDLGLA